jgi:hypothetical protein
MMNVTCGVLYGGEVCDECERKRKDKGSGSEKQGWERMKARDG